MNNSFDFFDILDVFLAKIIQEKYISDEFIFRYRKTKCRLFFYRRKI